MGKIITFLLIIFAVGFPNCNALLPKCWKKFGECLDSNEPPLDVNNKVKPRANVNIVKTVPNIFTQEDCLSQCEMERECNYYTLYKPDVMKGCKLVGFNLGTSCERLENVCVLLRNCTIMDPTCGPRCEMGRRLNLDLKDKWHTLVVGGVRNKRTEYEASIEVRSPNSSLCSLQTGLTNLGEGLAGAYIPTAGKVIACGGFRDTAYIPDCETMTQAAGWQNSADAMGTARAFHNMVAVGDKAYAIGGYNDVDGMLDSIEMYDTAWTAQTVKLPSPRSHMCSVKVTLNGQDSIFVLGGWGGDQVFVSDVLKYDVGTGGELTQDTSFSATLPLDKQGVENGRGDMACLSIRLDGFNDGILLTGGYRSTGWLNTVWFLNLTSATQPWVRLDDLAVAFDDGRHYHGMSTAGGQPIIMGGWQNYPMDSVRMFDYCTSADITRPGSWKDTVGLAVGREKAAYIPLKSGSLPVGWGCM